MPVAVVAPYPAPVSSCSKKKFFAISDIYTTGPVVFGEKKARNSVMKSAVNERRSRAFACFFTAAEKPVSFPPNTKINFNFN